MSDRRQELGWAAALKTAAKRFETFYPPLEPMFLATGERLRELHGKVAELSEKSETAGQRLSSSDFAEMLEGLTEAARLIDTLRQVRGGQSAALAQMVTTTDAMLASLTALNRIMSHVRVLAVNAKIEASQMINSGIDFSVFTREIARLASGGDQTIQAVRDELIGLRAAAAKALHLQRAFEEKGLPELDALAGRLAGSIHSMRDRQSRVTQGIHDIPPRLRQLFANIANLVSDLQIYDITRQRLEHVEQALTLAAGMIEADNASDMDDRQVRVFVNGIADLQSRQLAHGGEAYHTAVRDVGHSLAEMARGAPAVGALCEQTFGGGGGLSLLDIDRDLETACQVFAAFATSREQAESSLGHVVQAAVRAGDLMRSLNSVNGDMRLMGLNASITCGNMGSVGRSLNVIAQELQSYASLTRDHVGTVAGNLTRITTVAQEIGHTESDGPNPQTSGLKTMLEEAVARVRSIGTEIAELLSAIGELGGRVVEITRVADQGFSGRADCRAAMDETIRELAVIMAGSDSGLSGAELEAARREVLAFTESHYTMASERSIHGSAVDGRNIVDVLTGADFAEAGSGGRPGGEPDISSLLF